MLLLLAMIISVTAITHAVPIPDDSQNTTIIKIEDFFQHSLNGLAGALISQHNDSSTDHYQSSDGSIHAVVKPLNLIPLQAIAFRPNNNQLVLHNATNLFKNETVGVDLIEVDLKPSSEPTPAVVTQTSTEKSAILSEIPTTVISGITNTDDVKTSDAKTSSGVNEATLSPHATTVKEPVEIVTPVKELYDQYVTSATVSKHQNSAESSESSESSESKEDIKTKIKEVEAEPVILTAGV